MTGLGSARQRLSGVVRAARAALADAATQSTPVKDQDCGLLALQSQGARSARSAPQWRLAEISMTEKTRDGKADGFGFLGIYILADGANRGIYRISIYC